MKQIIFVLISAIIMGCGNRNSSTMVDISKTALVTYQTSPLFVTELRGDSLIHFFKENSLRKSLPAAFNHDSLMKMTDQVNYNILALPFIKEKYNHRFEPGSFAPFCYEFNPTHQFHSFYIYLQSKRNGDAYAAIMLFTCDAQLRNIDYVALAEIYHISPNKGKSKTYKRINLNSFYTKYESYEIEYKEMGKGTHYEEKINSTIRITNTGKIEQTKSDEIRSAKIVRFDC